ncbi:DUF1131 family protein [Coralliovum pocilloporae]|uniref:DUF1131 family protein n=1 Tax=Coralliovum pocilloporae TaxID=3066369 RepID=UPI003306D28C
MLRLRTAFPALCLTVLLAACQPDSQNDFIAAASLPQPVTAIRTERAATITPETRYGSRALKNALPGYELEGVQIAVEDRTLWTLAAFHNGEQMLQILKGDDGAVSAVHGVSQRVAGPNGEQIGMTFVESGLRRSECRVGRNLWRGMAVCQARNAQNVKLVFSVPGYEGPFDQIPEPAQLRTATLQRIVWTPEN